MTVDLEIDVALHRPGVDVRDGVASIVKGNQQRRRGDPTNYQHNPPATTQPPRHRKDMRL